MGYQLRRGLHHARVLQSNRTDNRVDNRVGGAHNTRSRLDLDLGQPPSRLQASVDTVPESLTTS
jgi:hypothetical protein